MSVTPFPTIPSACSIDSSLRMLATRAPSWQFSPVFCDIREPVVRATSCTTGVVINARWTGSEWIVLTTEPAMIGRARHLVTAFEQALSLSK